MAIAFIRSGGVNGGTSFTMDIGTAGTNRLIIIAAAFEGSQTTLTDVTVDGKSSTLILDAFNAEGVGNNMEMWRIKEGALGASNGVVTISIVGGSTDWGIAASLYTGVRQDGLDDSGMDNTTINSATSTINNITTVDGGLVVAAASHGDIPTTADYSSHTSPLTLRETRLPTSAELYLLDGIETTGQTNKTYTLTLTEATNRFSHAIAAFDPASEIKQTHQMML